jgi:hypothetical protein
MVFGKEIRDSMGKSTEPTDNYMHDLLSPLMQGMAWVRIQTGIQRVASIEPRAVQLSQNLDLPCNAVDVVSHLARSGGSHMAMARVWPI